MGLGIKVWGWVLSVSCVIESECQPRTLVTVLDLLAVRLSWAPKPLEFVNEIKTRVLYKAINKITWTVMHKQRRLRQDTHSVLYSLFSPTRKHPLAARPQNCGRIRHYVHVFTSCYNTPATRTRTRSGLQLICKPKRSSSDCVLLFLCVCGHFSANLH